MNPSCCGNASYQAVAKAESLCADSHMDCRLRSRDATRRDRVDIIREQLFGSDHQRDNYCQRFAVSQSIAQHDPWAERAEGSNEFTALTLPALQGVA